MCKNYMNIPVKVIEYLKKKFVKYFCRNFKN